MSRPVRVDFIADVVCPWCALGSVALEQAITNLHGEIVVQLTYKPFELNPDMPAQGEQATQHMMRKYGRTAEEVASRNAMTIGRGREIGFHFDLEKRTHFYNTFDAHRLLLWATRFGLQRDLKTALFQAYFTQGENPSDHETLARLAADVGLDSTLAREVLATDQYAHEVRELERFNQQLGISSVPAMVLNGHRLVAGSQSPEFYEQLLRQEAAEFFEP